MPKPGDEQHTGAALFGLFSTFPSQNVSDAVMQAKMAMYLDVLTQFPAWAAKKAVRFWMAAEHSEAGDNHAFPPSPPQLARLARLAMRDVYQQIHRFETMAAAKPAVPDPTPEQKARADALVASFRWNTMKGEVA